MIIQKEFFLFDCFNLLKNNPINRKMSQDLFHHTLKNFLSFLKNLAMWRQMGLNDAAWLIFSEINEKLLTSAKLSHEKCSNA